MTNMSMTILIQMEVASTIIRIPRMITMVVLKGALTHVTRVIGRPIGIILVGVAIIGKINV
ncbi:hypothetical protein KDK_05440 [Dictyobacter kobayashii]|uniref:Uncharacterized protein n=1 Tax=Dictyobacter kobayashii TaxID=2014872 RepID=A0A402ACB5_9CHLR|nr:hypothetical protein KDK_05440 [Dictyobacter kobayashii]